MRYPLIAAALVAVLSWSGPASAQTVAGCGTTTVAKADRTNRARLEAQIACFAKAGDAAGTAIATRRALIAALTPVPAPSPAPGPTPTPVAWTRCAGEGGTCAITGTARVRFGIGNAWLERVATGQIACSREAFGGDPAEGKTKVCETTGTPVTAPVPAPTGSTGPAAQPLAADAPGGPVSIWMRCAYEGETCTVPGTADVRFGADTRYAVVRAVSGTVACSRDRFGDPASGATKTCSYRVAGDARDPLPSATGFQLGVNVGVPNYYSGEPTFANLLTGEGWRIVSTKRGERDMMDADGNLTLVAGEKVGKNITTPVTVLKGGTATIMCTWDGSADVSVGGNRGRTIEQAPGRYVVEMLGWTKDSWGSTAWLDVNGTGPAGARNFDCREKGVARDALFDASVLDSLRPFKVLRFLDWSGANGNPDKVTWASRTTPSMLNQAQGPTGIAVEHMIALANATGAAPWYNVPWHADEDYHRRVAKLFHDRVPADRKVYVELSNEVWNYTFSVTHQAQAEGLAKGLSDNGLFAAVLRYAEKTRWAMAIWAQVFADRPGQLVRVAATQPGPGLADMILGKGKLAGSVDALAVAPYIGGDILARNPGTTDLPAVLAALRGEAAATPARLAEIKEAVRVFGVRLIAYEGGQHLTGENVAMIRAANRAPEMEGIYRDYLGAWRSAVGDLFVHFNSSSPISVYGAWGLQEYVGQPISEAPKMRAALGVSR